MMKKLLATTILAAIALLADGQTVWWFEATEGDGEQGADAAAKTQKKTPKTGDTTVLNLPGGEKMVLIYCAPGEFMMGSENGECCEKPIHKVRLTYGFWMGKYEVTQKQWNSVMGTNPSARKGDYLPVDSVRRGDCNQFMRKIEAHCHGVRAWLPTEAQWEYACRAGTKGDYAGEIDLMGWHAGNSDNRPHPVGRLLPNAWGFCDMHGNVWEMCNDLFGEDYYSKSPVNDPPGASMPSNNALREAHRKGELGSVVIPRAYVLRGGCWYLDAKDCRSSRRHAIGFGAVPEQLIGFRICCVLPGELVFSGNTVANNRARGVLFTMPKRIVCEGNFFDHVSGSAILLAGDAQGWYESGACEDLVIRKNRFRDCLTSVFQYCDALVSIHPEVKDLASQRRRYHRNILVEDNDIETFDVPLLFALSAENVTWRNNRVKRHGRYRGWERKPFEFKGCSHVVVDGDVVAP